MTPSRLRAPAFFLPLVFSATTLVGLASCSEEAVQRNASSSCSGDAGSEGDGMSSDDVAQDSGLSEERLAECATASDGQPFSGCPCSGEPALCCSFSGLFFMCIHGRWTFGGPCDALFEGDQAECGPGL